MPEENSSSLNDNLSVISIKGGTLGGDVTISLSDGSSFFISPESVLDLHLYPEKMLSPEDLELLRETAAEHGAAKKTLDLLSRAEQSRQGLSQKLLRKGYSKSIIERVLDRFEDQGYLSDRRFAEAWVRSRLKKHPEGTAALLSGLRKRGVDGKTAESVVTALVTEEIEWEALNRAAEKLSRRSGVTQEKLITRLLGWGFAWGRIKQYIGDVNKKNS